MKQFPKNAKDLSGNVYTKLTVVRWHGRDPKGKLTWECICDCGNACVVRGTNLKTGNTKSCGCGFTHGMSRTPTYKSWEMMIQRCTNINFTSYQDYGGRGITVCEDWLIFDNFYRDMGIRPQGKSIDRIDNSKGYCKENCKWSSQSEQSKNTRVRKDNTSGIKGVYYHKYSGKWMAYLHIDNNSKYLGLFNSKDEAFLAREKSYYDYSEESS